MPLRVQRWSVWMLLGVPSFWKGRRLRLFVEGRHNPRYLGLKYLSMLRMEKRKECWGGVSILHMHRTKMGVTMRAFTLYISLCLHLLKKNTPKNWNICSTAPLSSIFVIRVPGQCAWSRSSLGGTKQQSITSFSVGNTQPKLGRAINSFYAQERQG